MTDQPQNPWLALATRITAAERTYRELADGYWQSLDVTKAVHYRGMADGLAMARDQQLEVVREARDAD